jgi:hypothetical protein
LLAETNNETEDEIAQDIPVITEQPQAVSPDQGSSLNKHGDLLQSTWCALNHVVREPWPKAKRDLIGDDMSAWSIKPLIVSGNSRGPILAHSAAWDLYQSRTLEYLEKDPLNAKAKDGWYGAERTRLMMMEHVDSLISRGVGTSMAGIGARLILIGAGFSPKNVLGRNIPIIVSRKPGNFLESININKLKVWGASDYFTRSDFNVLDVPRGSPMHVDNEFGELCREAWVVVNSGRSGKVHLYSDYTISPFVGIEGDRLSLACLAIFRWLSVTCRSVNFDEDSFLMASMFMGLKTTNDNRNRQCSFEYRKTFRNQVDDVGTAFADLADSMSLFNQAEGEYAMEKTTQKKHTAVHIVRDNIKHVISSVESLLILDHGKEKAAKIKEMAGYHEKYSKKTDERDDMFVGSIDLDLGGWYLLGESGAVELQISLPCPVVLWATCSGYITRSDNLRAHGARRAVIDKSSMMDLIEDVWIYNATSLESGFAKAGLGFDLWAWGWSGLPCGPADPEGITKLTMEQVLNVFNPMLGLDINTSSCELAPFVDMPSRSAVPGCCRVAPWIRILMDGLEFSNREAPTLGNNNRMQNTGVLVGGCWEITEYNSSGLTYLTHGKDAVTQLVQYGHLVVSELGITREVGMAMWSGLGYHASEMRSVNIMPKVSATMGRLRVLVGGTPLPQPGGLSPFGTLIIPRSGDYVQGTQTYGPIILGAVSRFCP